MGRVMLHSMHRLVARRSSSWFGVAILLASRAAFATEGPDDPESDTEVDADAEHDVRGHHLSASWATAPIGAIGVLGADGAVSEAPLGLVEMGPQFEYEARVAKVFGFGVGMAYRIALNGEREALYGHFVEVPAHIRVALPLSDRIEIGAVGHFGFTHGWLIGHGPTLVQGDGALRVVGMTLGPKLVGAIRWTETVDALVGVGASWRMANVTNGEGYAQPAAIVGLSVPVDLGARVRF